MQPLVNPATSGEDRSVRRFWLGAGAAVVLLALGLRVWQIDGPYEHFDEVIAVHVSQHLSKTDSWDVNWRVAQVPLFSAHDQYNFSAYLYATHFFRRAVKALDSSPRWRERDGLVAHRLFSGLCGAAAVGVLMAVGRRCGGRTVGIAAGLLAAINPQLIEDAHYARPETFMTLLMILVAWLAFLPIRAWRVGAMGLLVGFAVATKASNAALVVLPGFAIGWDACSRSGVWWRPAWRPMLHGVVLLLLGVVAGWAAGVPFALSHWAEYRSGLSVLAQQYAGSHPPHSFPDHRPVWSLMGRYYIATLGWPMLVAAGLGLAVLARRRRWLAIGLLGLPLAVSIVLFGSQRVFFERNLSPVLPGGLALAAVGLGGAFLFLRTRWGRAAAVFCALMLASTPALRVDGLFLGRGTTGEVKAGLQAFQEKLGRDYAGVRVAHGSLFSADEFSWLRGELKYGQGELLYLLLDFNDAYKVRYLPELAQHFHVLAVDEYNGAFADYPPSSLNVFHGGRMIAYRLRPR